MISDSFSVAETRRGVRTIETSHPPSYYIPRAHLRDGVLRRRGNVLAADGEIAHQTYLGVNADVEFDVVAI